MFRASMAAMANQGIPIIIDNRDYSEAVEFVAAMLHASDGDVRIFPNERDLQILGESAVHDSLESFVKDAPKGGLKLLFANLAQKRSKEGGALLEICQIRPERCEIGVQAGAHLGKDVVSIMTAGALMFRSDAGGYDRKPNAHASFNNRSHTQEMVARFEGMFSRRIPVELAGSALKM
jgi:hypothetical protein